MVIAVLTAALVLGGNAPKSPIIIGIEHNVRGAEFIVEGKVVEPSPKRDGRSYPFLVEKVHFGDMKVGQKIAVNSVSDWTCCNRFRDYQKDERLLLFIVADKEKEREKAGYKLFWGHFSEFVFLEEGKIRGCDGFYGSAKRTATNYLGLVRELVAFTRLEKKEEVAKAWEKWLSSDNPELAGFALARLALCDKYRWNYFSFDRSKGRFRMKGPSVLPVKELFDAKGCTVLYEKTVKLLSSKSHYVRTEAALAVDELDKLLEEKGVPEGFDLKQLRKSAVAGLKVVLAKVSRHFADDILDTLRELDR